MSNLTVGELKALLTRHNISFPTRGPYLPKSYFLELYEQHVINTPSVPSSSSAASEQVVNNGIRAVSSSNNSSSSSIINNSNQQLNSKRVNEDLEQNSSTTSKKTKLISDNVVQTYDASAEISIKSENPINCSIIIDGTTYEIKSPAKQKSTTTNERNIETTTTTSPPVAEKSTSMNSLSSPSAAASSSSSIASKSMPSTSLNRKEPSFQAPTKYIYNITVLDDEGDIQVRMTVPPHMPSNRIIQEIAKHMGKEVVDLHFSVDGERISGRETSQYFVDYCGQTPDNIELFVRPEQAGG